VVGNSSKHVLLMRLGDMQWVCCACVCASTVPQHNKHDECHTLSRRMQVLPMRHDADGLAHPTPASPVCVQGCAPARRAQDAIERLRALEAEGDLTGVMDDRGKYIYISRDEMAAVADFIRRRGRVAVAELAAQVLAAQHSLPSLRMQQPLQQPC